MIEEELDQQAAMLREAHALQVENTPRKVVSLPVPKRRFSGQDTVPQGYRPTAIKHRSRFMQRGPSW
jgi:hypothetical protein